MLDPNGYDHEQRLPPRTVMQSQSESATSRTEPARHGAQRRIFRDIPSLIAQIRTG